VGVDSNVIIDANQTGMVSVNRTTVRGGGGRGGVRDVFLEGFGSLQNGRSSTIGHK